MEPRRPQLLQFRLRSLLLLVAIASVLLALLRWFDIPAATASLALLLVAAALVVGFAVVLAISRAIDDRGDPPE